MANCNDEVFGERYLTPEENKRKQQMYKDMSDTINTDEALDWLFADIDELIDCDFDITEEAIESFKQEG